MLVGLYGVHPLGITPLVHTTLAPWEPPTQVERSISRSFHIVSAIAVDTDFVYAPPSNPYKRLSRFGLRRFVDDILTL